MRGGEAKKTLNLIESLKRYTVLSSLSRINKFQGCQNKKIKNCKKNRLSNNTKK